ncbi:DUF418 domain-containing protein [Sphingomonas sp. HF-S3]|uniref:DUF418 domain-containing protein n=1 Tax=Sphingomonas rustica TaxID=3103142 RepID=A0ABV0BCF0_9SPHN
MIEPDRSLARLQSLDTVRGIAVMGILLLNIVGFAMPEAAYYNPRAYGGSDGIDLAVYLVNFVLFDGKMRGLFSFLFGASMLMVIERAEAKGENPARVHFMRMAWLFVFGLLHLYLLWVGDILAHYAMIGILAYFCRRMAPARLIALGIVLVLVQTLFFTLMFPVLVHVIQNGTPDAGGAQTLAGYQRSFGIPPADDIASALALHRGDHAGLVADRLRQFPMGPLPMTMIFGWETLAYMLFGMAALRTGMLRGEWGRIAYRRGAMIGLGIGIPAYAALVAWQVASGFSLFSVLTAFTAAVPLRPVMVVGWLCLILLTMRPDGRWTQRIAATGRMAFTNYLATSLICTTLFYGYGLGWYGHLGRAQLYLVVVAMWALMLLWSQPWLARFRYGPLEWLWRSLARMRFQPIRGSAALAD